MSSLCLNIMSLNTYIGLRISSPRAPLTIWIRIAGIRRLEKQLGPERDSRRPAVVYQISELTRQ